MNDRMAVESGTRVPMLRQDQQLADLQRENSRLRELVVQLSKIVMKNAAQSKH